MYQDGLRDAGDGLGNTGDGLGDARWGWGMMGMDWGVLGMDWGGAGEELEHARKGWRVLGRKWGVVGMVWGVPGEAGGAGVDWECWGGTGGCWGWAEVCLEGLGDSLDGSKLPGWNRESVSAGARDVFQHRSYPNWFLLRLSLVLPAAGKPR